MNEERIRVSKETKKKIKVETVKREFKSEGRFVEACVNYVTKNKIQLK